MLILPLDAQLPVSPVNNNDCERVNLDQPGHHLRMKHPEWNVDILETHTRAWLFVFVVFHRCAWCT